MDYDTMDEMKPYKCPICGGVDYYFHVSGPRRHRYCKSCANKRSKAWYQKNKGTQNFKAQQKKIWEQPKVKEYQRDWKLKKNYGLSAEEYDRQLEKQEGKCKICGKPPRLSTTHPRLVIDHFHDSGKIRGLICNTCNVGIGRFDDNPEILRAAVIYLEAFNGL